MGRMGAAYPPKEMGRLGNKKVGRFLLYSRGQAWMEIDHIKQPMDFSGIL